MAKTALQVGGLPITPKQLIAGIASLGIAVGEFFLLKDMSMNAKMPKLFSTVYLTQMQTVLLWGLRVIVYNFIGAFNPNGGQSETTATPTSIIHTNHRSGSITISTF